MLDALRKAMTRPDSRREHWLAAAVLALVVLFTFRHIVFGGRSLVPSDSINPLDYRMRGPDPVPPEEWTRHGYVLYPNFRDIASAIQQTDPAREFLRRSLRAGEFPFWDPYLGGGAPSFASLSPAYLFPPSLLVVLLGNGRLITNIYILALIYCGGLFTYFVLRRHVDHWGASLAGAIAFMLSGAVVTTAPSVIGQPVALFSLPVLMTARLVEQSSVRRAAQLALAFAFVAMATFPPVLLQAFAIAVLYLLLTRPPARTVAWFAAGASVALLIVAFAYLPAIRLMAETTHIREYYRHAAAATVPLSFLPQLLSPRIAGGAVTYADPVVGINAGVYFYYVGGVALFLAGLGLLARASERGRTLWLCALLIAGMALLKMIGAPPMQWLEHVPFLWNFHYAAYSGIALAYAAGMLAALGIDALVERRVRIAHVAVTAATLAVLIVDLRVANAARIAIHPNGAEWLAEWGLLLALLAAATLSAVIAIRTSRTRGAVAFVLLVLIAEGMHNDVFPRPRPWDHWAHPPRYIEILQSRNTNGRVLPMPIFPANTESVFRQPALDSILTASPRVHEMYRRYFGPIPDPILRESTRIPPEGVLDAANIEYFAIVSSDVASLSEVARRGYVTLHADDYMHLVSRRTRPRYSFTSRYEVVDEKTALDRLPELPRDVALVEEVPHFPSTPGAEVIPRVVKLGLNEVILEVDTRRAGLLVCSESYMNGWSATIDGHPVRILPANYAFRAVEVSPGSHRVRFAYRAPGWRGGVALSLAGLFLCASGLVAGMRSKHA